MIKTEFIELYEELNSLNEAVSPEAQAFYKSLNVRTKDPVDTESFIKAFKKDIPDNIWDQLFTVDMRLKNRGTYGIIKNGNLPAEVTTALKKYWAFQFASSVTWFETTTMIAKEEEAKRKEEEAKKAQEEKLAEEAKEYIDRANHVLTLVDKTAMQKLLQLSKELEPEVANRISETPKVSTNHYINQKNRLGEPYSTVNIRFYDFWVKVYDGYYGDKSSIPTEQEVVDKFNDSVLRAIERLEKIKAEKLAKQNRQEKYKNAKWYSKEFEEWASANSKGIFLFQLPDDEGIQRLTRLSWDIVERCRFTDDVELIAVITDYDQPMRNPNSATENSYYYRYYSVNSKADPADLEDEGILLDPSKFVDKSTWGEQTYKEISKDSINSHSGYFITGMDRWFKYTSVAYGTE